MKWVLAGAFTLGLGVTQAQDFRLESAGARFGFAASDSGSDFRQGEAFVDWNLPWGWDLGAQWRLQTRLDLSAGWLGETGQAGLDSFLGSVGPILALSCGRFPVSLEGGFSPTILSRDNFHSKNFGDPLQFTSHIGIGCDIASRVRISSRFQHMSNAGLSGDNPGLNMHMFGISYLF